jgi:exosortase
MDAVRHPRRLGFAVPPTAFLGGRRLPIRAAVLLVAALVAYNYSLQTLLRGITLQTPLGYLALVPVVALILAWVRLAREPEPLPIHDRQIDYIVGLTLLAVAAGIAFLAPAAVRFWLNRYDLLGLPFFVAGMITLLYGVRRMWALKFPILFLFLAWPVPYAPLVGDGMEAFTDFTAAAVGTLSTWIPTARPSPVDPTMFFIGNGSRAFAVSIGSACSGVNSLVGFLIIGGAFAYAVRGPALRRLLWLAGGLVLVWLLNIVRIEAIFAIGAGFGQAAALDVLHPVAGLIVFNLGVLGMLLAIRPMGLRFMDMQAPERAAEGRTPVSRVRVPVIVAGALALSLGATNASYARFEAISNDLGQARLQAFNLKRVAVPDWKIAPLGHFDNAKQFFGESATWNRVLYASTASASLQTRAPVFVDVINTDDAGAFSAYGVEACYKFHGYRIETAAEVDIGGGVKGLILDYHNPKLGNDWSAVTWEWPYAKGGQTWYERMVVFIKDGPKTTYTGSDPAVPTFGSARFADTDRFLVTLARVIVRSHLAQSTASR